MAAQHDMSADIKLAEQNASSITLGIDGAPHDPQKLTKMLREHGMTQTVISCKLVHELAQPNSITGALDLALDDGSTKRLFVKKMTAAQVAHKAWNDRRRSLLYMRNEVRFYSEFPELKERGVRYPMVYGVEDQLEKVTGQLGGAVPEEPSDLSKCGALLWMEPVLGYDQGSPLPADKSALILSAVARLHAASWEDTNLLRRASERLQHPGGSFALKIRNPAELEKIIPNWETFKTNFAKEAPAGFFDKRVNLGERLRRAAPWVAAQLAPLPTDRHACLVHGDLKAMNAFLPRDNPDPDALLIDFASTGVGYGMADVAMHLCHALMPGDLRTHEADLLQRYLRFLGQEDYDPLLARRHYELATIDYGRFVLGRFWGAASPDAFWEKRHKSNVALVHRNVPAALHFVERLDAYLAKYEGEISLIT